MYVPFHGFSIFRIGGKQKSHSSPKFVKKNVFRSIYSVYLCVSLFFCYLKNDIVLYIEQIGHIYIIRVNRLL
ncbi:hypothetical protein J2Z37_004138 [Ammoniphilus resinae]|uniref:Uncharacterized protein n=1 Tax=Ammoniphilus resinae TaxID=861532 RepID=A0ABS4GV39_9BACL|nr:hypothetical protein [Ammoniphilus resinae]